MSSLSDPFLKIPKPEWPPQLEALNVPKHKVLSDFLRNCSKSPSCRTVAVTSLVMSLWQIAGRSMSRCVPSLVLIGSKDQKPGIVGQLARQLMSGHRCSEPGVCTSGSFAYGKPKLAPKAMANAIVRMEKQRRLKHPRRESCEIYQQRFFDAMRTGFGAGACRPYSKAWHKKFQLLTGNRQELILQLESPADSEAFRRDVLNEPDKLRGPVGYSEDLQLALKTTSVSGEIPLKVWDADFAAKMTELGLPMLFLPSPAETPPLCSNEPVLHTISTTIANAFQPPVEEPTNFPPEQWFEIYQNELRKRLRYLPADYEYCIQRLARQLLPACQRIACWCGKSATRTELDTLCLSLHAHTLRGLVLSISGLAWHGLGFETGATPADTLKVLKCLRERGPISGSALLRATHLKKERRDEILKSLAEERLVRVEGKTLKAVTFREFVTYLYTGRNLPPVPDFHPPKKKKKATA